MESVINWDNILNNIYEQLKKTLRQAFQQENMHITSTNLESINKDLLYLKDEYNVYFEKLEDIKKIKEENINDYIKNVQYFEGKQDIKQKDKIITILSYGSILAIDSNINKKSQEEIYTISYTTRVIDKNNLVDYIPIIINDKIIQIIMEKNTIQERDNIVFEITQHIDQTNITEEILVDNIIKHY